MSSVSAKLKFPKVPKITRPEYFLGYNLRSSTDLLFSSEKFWLQFELLFLLVYVIYQVDLYLNCVLEVKEAGSELCTGNIVQEMWPKETPHC